MRFFKVVEIKDRTPVSVVFHDPVSGSVMCRSKVESFFMSFDNMRKMDLLKVVKEDCQGNSVLRFLSVQSTDYDYIERLLNIVCGGFWQVIEEGTCISREETIDSVVSEFFGYSAS